VREADTGHVTLIAEGTSPLDMLLHPRHEAAQKVLPELITQLRQCTNVEEGYEFQKALLDHVLVAETDRNGFSQAVKRMRAGKPPQANAPEPQSGFDVWLPETWEFERDVCARVARQFRCVGDALAWRVFGFQRQHIIALSQSAPPGVMAGKKGLQAELAEVEKAHTAGQFALLHDLTNCLRIGDVTIFGIDGTATVIEVKSDPERRSPVQRRRIAAAAAAVHSGGPLPGQDHRTRLYDLDLPFRTHLKILRDGTERAANDGLFAAKIPGDRALLVADVYGCSVQGWTEEEFNEHADSKLRSVLRRAGLAGDDQWLVMATSLDSVSRDPLRVPFAAYPLHPIACARIIGDLTVFSIVTNGQVLAESVRRAGINATWAVEPGPREMLPGEVVMRMIATSSAPAPAEINRLLHRDNLRMESSRTLEMRRAELDMYLIQLLEQETWIEGVRYMLTDPELNWRPWPHFRGEDRAWV
jgi:hypothetical protein